MTARADGEPPHVIFGDCLSGSASRVKVTVERVEQARKLAPSSSQEFAQLFVRGRFGPVEPGRSP